MEQDSNPHLLNAKHILLNVSIKLSRNCRILSFRQVIVPQSKAHFLRWFPKIGCKVNEYSYVSGQFWQTITKYRTLQDIYRYIMYIPQRGFIIYKGVGFHFADFISFFLSILWKRNNLVSLKPNYFIFIGHLKMGGGGGGEGGWANPWNSSGSTTAWPERSFWSSWMLFMLFVVCWLFFSKLTFFKHY